MNVAAGLLGRSAACVAVGVVAVALASAPRAQSAPCARAIAAADSVYRDGRFADVEQRLSPCLTEGTPFPAAAYRLLALALIRQQRLTEAQETVLELLAAHPDYEPNPVQDPPVYVSLVTLVARQVALDRRPPSAEPVAPEPVAPEPVAPEPPAVALPTGASALPGPPPVRAPRTVWVEGTLGAESYDGERRQVGRGALGGFVGNGGLSLAAAVAVQVTPWAALDLRAGLSRLPNLVRDGLPDRESGYPTDASGALGFPVTTYPTLDASTTSRQVGSVALALRVDPRLGWAVAPYVRVGARAVLRRTDGATRVGVGPTLAAGVQTSLGQALAAFGEGTASLVVPDRALDDAVFRSNGDLLLGVYAGLRYRLTAPR